MLTRMENGDTIKLTAKEEAAFNTQSGAVEGYLSDERIKRQITVIEATITPRRLREAVLGTDEGWLETQNAAIAVLRSQLS